MPKTNPVDDQQEYVVLRIPAVAWDLLSETLQVDAKSTAFEPVLRQNIAEALGQVQVVASSLHPFLGHIIQDVRDLTKADAGDNDWFLPGHTCPVMVLDNGTIIFPSKDRKGNGPGALFGKMADGTTIYVDPEGS